MEETAAATVSSNNFLESTFVLLGKKLPLLFGRECIKASIWMITALVLRAIVIVMQLDSFIPAGFFFAFPYSIQVLLFYYTL